ncbi:MAG: hypothetical protein WBM68_14515 [Woeseia sp.]
MARMLVGIPVILLVDSTTRKTRDDAILHGASDIVESSMMPPYLAQRILDVLEDSRAIDGVQPGRIPLAGTDNIVMRSIRQDDAARERSFLQCLSRANIAPDFFSSVCDLEKMKPASSAPAECSVSNTLVAVTTGRGNDRIIGITRFEPKDGSSTAGFVLATLDGWREKGVISQLLRGMIANAAVAGIQKLEGSVAVHDASMLEVARQLGFDIANVDTATDQCNVSKTIRTKNTAHHAMSDPDKRSGSASGGMSKWARMYRTVIAAARRAWRRFIAAGSHRINKC